MLKKISINSKTYKIEGDTTYLTNIIRDYEPFTINIFKNFCRNYFNVLDIGAHIGLSAIVLASICKKGRL
ncbi:hypothetical protein BEV13_01905 [Rickettsiella grylli]|nr:hypothetical protein BEV13_01905 [Rickettsiella grylli]